MYIHFDVLQCILNGFSCCTLLPIQEKGIGIVCYLVSKLFLFLFFFICHTIITKDIGKEEKKKWRGDLTETMGAYEGLGLLELWARPVSHQLKKRW